eukprot:6000510-Amphidinium_carterae.1
MVSSTALLWLLWLAPQLLLGQTRTSSSSSSLSSSSSGGSYPYQNSCSSSVCTTPGVTPMPSPSRWEQFRSWLSMKNSSLVHETESLEFEYEYGYYYGGYFADNGGDYQYEYYLYYHDDAVDVSAKQYEGHTYYYWYYHEYYYVSHKAAMVPASKVVVRSSPMILDVFKALSLTGSLATRVWSLGSSEQQNSAVACSASSYGYYYSHHAQHETDSTPFWTLAATLCASPFAIRQRRHLVAMCNVLRQVQQGCCADLLQVGLILVTCICNLALVMVKRIPARLGKRHARKIVLRVRSVCLKCLGDTMIEPAAEVTPVDGKLGHRTSHVPLQFIQREGGKALRATWGGRRRLCKPRFRSYSVLHNPTTPGECLFSSLRYIIAKSGQGVFSTKALRRMVRAELIMSINSHEKLHGQPVQHWAKQIGVSEADLVSTCSGSYRRWGNTLDLYLIARLFNLNVKVVSRRTGRIITEHSNGSGKMWTVGFGAHHFTVLKSGPRRGVSQRPRTIFRRPRRAQQVSGGSLAHNTKVRSCYALRETQVRASSVDLGELGWQVVPWYSLRSLRTSATWWTYASSPLMSWKIWYAMCSSSGRMDDEGACFVQGGAGSSTDNTQTSKRSRPYLFGPAFSAVQAFPPPDLSRVIETTAHYVARSGEEFKRRVVAKSKADNTPHMCDFMEEGHTYYEFYVACRELELTNIARETVDLTTGSSGAASEAARSR